jgi:hypothetical protein
MDFLKSASCSREKRLPKKKPQSTVTDGMPKLMSCLANITSALDPYAYTAGRWLNYDKLEREARHITFDFDTLCKVAVQLCPGATTVARYEKHEGSYNRVFVLELDNGKRIVARVPTSVAGPPRLMTNSEVATMTYCEC